MASRSQVLISILILTSPLRVGAQDLVASDSAAIFAAMERWEGWRIRDADLASQDYSGEADWTNAFGMRRIGRPAIHELLAEVFALPFVMAGETEYEFHDLTSVGANVALLRSRAIRTGQELPDGTVGEPRRTNHLRVFEKRNGTWSIVSHLIGDERTPGEPR